MDCFFYLYTGKVWYGAVDSNYVKKWNKINKYITVSTN